MSGSRGKQDGPSPTSGNEAASLGDRIKTLRESLGLNQAEFGAKLGVSKNTVWNYENGTSVTHDILVQICTLFDIDARWLLLGVGSPQAHHAARESVDLLVLEEVVRAAETALTAQRLVVPAEKKGQLMVLLYEQIRDERRRDATAKIDPARFANIIRLAI